MKTIKQDGVAWFLEDERLIEAVVGLVAELRDDRRAYFTVPYGDRTIFVKFFREKGILGFVRNWINPRGRREFLLGKSLESFSVATPQPLGYGLSRKGSFVLQEWIDAQPLWSFISDPSLRPGLLKGLAHLLLQLRERRVLHNDLHLGNVLCKDDRLYLIDLHKSRIKERFFSESDEVKNLCHVMGDFYQEMTEDEKERFFQIYGKPAVRSILEKELVAQRAEWIQRKKDRAFSTTSKLRQVGRRVYVEGAQGTAEDVLIECIKDDKKVQVDRYSDHIRKIYRHNRRLKKAWRNHVAVEYLLLPILPKPFYVQKGSFCESGFIAMEDLQDRGEELDRYLDRHYDTMESQTAHRFIDLLSDFLSTLLRKGILHRDMKACNLFVLEDGFRLLDVEDIIFRPYTEEDMRNMFCQLNLSVPRRICFHHRARFFLKITGRLGIERSERRRLFREVLRATTGEAIVYQGIDGLRKESWTQTVTEHHG